MTFDLIIRTPRCPTGDGVDIACAGGKIAAIEPSITAEAGRVDRRDRPARLAALRRLPFPHGRDAVARPAAHERLRHAARRHRALGRAEAAADRRGGDGAGAPLLRPRRVEGPARHPHACRHLRRPADRRRRAARGEEADRALYRPAARRLSAGRLFPLAQRREESGARARQGRRRRRRHPAFRAHDGGRRREPAARSARSPRSAGCSSTCIATRPTIRCRATSRRWPTRRSGSACRAASPARTSPPCIPWTITTSRSCCR